MKKHQRKRRPSQQIKLWSYAEAARALPYVDAILRSLREELLESNQRRIEAGRAKDQPGRRTRTELISVAELERDADRAYARYLEGVQELQDLNVVCLDPVQGDVLFPFVYEGQVAWFMHNLFDGPRLLWWRYDSDSPDTRRPIYTDMRNLEQRSA